MPGVEPLDFVDVLRMQQSLQTGYDDGDPMTMQNNTHRIAFMQQQFVNIIVELVEALNEFGWKPWGSSEHVHAEQCLRELVDAQHFINNWLLTLAPLLGCQNVDELAQRFLSEYEEKHFVNVDRQSGNYNGFDEKCDGCGREREMADRIMVEGVVKALVCPCGRIWDNV